MSRDTLSDVLRSVRLRGVVFYFVSGGSEWAAEAPASREIAATVMPGAQHVMEYHVVTQGRCWAAVVGDTPVALGTGDIVLFPHGDAHVMSSAPGLRAEADASGRFGERAGQLPFRLAYSGTTGPTSLERIAPDDTTLVCGFLGCDLRPFNPLIGTLPRLLHLSANGGDDWVAWLMRQAVAESLTQRPGGEAMLERMSEMMFVDAMRRYADALPAASTGWLAGLRDRAVGRALALLHHEPARAWSVDDLGREVGLSRSALHDRFVQFIGQPPMQYLAHWRIQLAATQLRATHATVATIALDVGYDSEAAFSRAFKRLVGLPPAAWRRQVRADSAA
ncbi:MAG TPA: AraC family transcriptional regulator [Ideonella sp.]|nr:AraC family transcriptional regulator [Ideonella sp.]